MQLAKPAIDFGLSTNHGDAHLAFWRADAGLALDHSLVVSEDQVQHRFDANGSVIKVNAFAGPLADRAPSGIREVLLARKGLSAPVRLNAPDGARVTLVPPGYLGIDQVGVRLSVKDPGGMQRFYSEALDLIEEDVGRLRAGRTLIILDPSDSGDGVPGGAGWRYLTLQVFRADQHHARLLTLGATEARPPMTLAHVARFSIFHDPEGNAIELSQRQDLVGTLA